MYELMISVHGHNDTEREKERKAEKTEGTQVW